MNFGSYPWGLGRGTGVFIKVRAIWAEEGENREWNGMNVLVTGAGGFIARNLIAGLQAYDGIRIFECGRTTGQSLLEEFCREADMVYHLAGSNRPKEITDYELTNVGFTRRLLELLKKHGNSCPVMFSSSIQALLDNPYGRSKKAAEELLLEYAEETGAKVFLYRLPNVFGKWCRPNYNSVIATLCHNTVGGLPTRINDAGHMMQLVYIEDLVRELTGLIGGGDRVSGFYEVPCTYRISLGRIVELVQAFQEGQEAGMMPELSDEFTRKLYDTYLSYMQPSGHMPDGAGIINGERNRA
ncbi:MAG TPA: NAD-dependent epimerase/dehydratase family protein [Clostridiales bacterium]|nr:NAD-dependent epimerase/dehydratase family protein [Clostridiales bacterium]